MALMRGARPSPRHRLAGAVPHIVTTPTPEQWLWKPAKLSMWGNDTYGDCTVAEEAFAKGCGSSGLFVPDSEVITWARTAGALNSDTLIDVLDKMQASGFVVGGKTYDDGPPAAIDWTNAALLRNAIANGPVKTGIAADQIETAYNTNPYGGWFGNGFTQESPEDEDHCISTCGYGSIEWLLSELGVDVPDGVDGSQPGYALYTWKSQGVVDVPSYLAITFETWLRTPNTIIAT